MIRHVLACALALPACFRPVFDHTACSRDGSCPSGLTCNTSGVCESPGSIASTDAAIDVPGGNPIDSGVDATLVDAGPPLCGGSFVHVCVNAPAADIHLTTQRIDTTASTMCAPYMVTPSVMACVIAGRSITIPAQNTVTVIGRAPLILLAETITITGILDVASHRGVTDGAGSNTTFCAGNAVPPTIGTARADGGGGSGGSYGGAGGAGGSGGEDGVGGVPSNARSTAELHGGCNGATGAGTGGIGGTGGGAVALNATTLLVIDGVVNASGGSGAGGKTSGGGGGGGSGGMIVLDAPTVNVTGQCFANGGGGGEGANTDAIGADGFESAAPALLGNGGALGTSIGGDGGDGGGGAAPAGRAGTKADEGPFGVLGGGGGGGGGAGVIHVLSTSASGTDDLAKVSPAPS